MKIMVNVQSLIKDKLEGLGWFSYETLKRITTQHPEHEFIFVFDRKYDKEFIFSNNIKPIVMPPPARHPLLWFVRNHIVFPMYIKKFKPDIFISMDGWLPIKHTVPTINIIHDINFEHFPKDLPFWVRKYYTHFFPKYARKASRLATVSQYSKDDIVKQYNILPEKIKVLYNGCNELYTPLEQTEIKIIRDKYSNGFPYFIFVGALNPRKNIANLLKAFDLFKKEAQLPHKLLIVGNKMWRTKEIEATYEQMQYKSDVHFTGRVSSFELKKLLGAAQAMTYVSIFEGFGIPILEAFNAGIPLITSNITSMPEIAGDAAYYIDPFDIYSIKNALVAVSTDENLRKALIEMGNKRKMLYSWQLTANRLWEVIEELMNEIKFNDGRVHSL